MIIYWLDDIFYLWLSFCWGITSWGKEDIWIENIEKKLRILDIYRIFDILCSAIYKYLQHCEGNYSWGLAWLAGLEQAHWPKMIGCAGPSQLGSLREEAVRQHVLVRSWKVNCLTLILADNPSTQGQGQSLSLNLDGWTNLKTWCTWPRPHCI